MEVVWMNSLTPNDMDDIREFAHKMSSIPSVLDSIGFVLKDELVPSVMMQEELLIRYINTFAPLYWRSFTADEIEAHSNARKLIFVLESALAEMQKDEYFDRYYAANETALQAWSKDSLKSAFKKLIPNQVKALMGRALQIASFERYLERLRFPLVVQISAEVLQRQADVLVPRWSAPILADVHMDVHFREHTKRISVCAADDIYAVKEILEAIVRSLEERNKEEVSTAISGVSLIQVEDDVLEIAGTPIRLCESQLIATLKSSIPVVHSFLMTEAAAVMRGAK